MELSRLRLSGFKSFVEPSLLLIEPGLTGVVGPNGCGKSNLLEAIRWVMGENAPRAMRSGGMEDVIFAGTARRPPREFAEVVLAGRDDAGEPLEIVRRIERGAGSAYRVNGEDVRAKDVALVLADAATGAHSPALVSQGRIAQVIAARPAERREMLEEAAGIAGLHVRRRDAEAKLRQTETNLARLEDTLASQGARMAALRRQAKQAERYRALTDAIRVAEGRLLFARWRDAERAAAEASEQAGRADRGVAEAKAALDKAQGDAADSSRELAAARDLLAERREAAAAHRHRAATLAERLDAAKQRLTDLDRQTERLESERAASDRLTRDGADTLAKLERDRVDGAARLNEMEAARPDLARDLDRAERRVREAELALAKAQADRATMMADRRIAEAALAQAGERLSRNEDEHRRLAEERAQLSGPQDVDVEAANDERQRASGALDTAHNSLEQARTRRLAAQQARDDAASALSSARAELAAATREHAVLSRTGKVSTTTGQRAIDAVQVAEGYERALSAVLGAAAEGHVGAISEGAQAGHFWTGRSPPDRVEGSLAEHVLACPDELAARLALTHVAARDDGRDLAPGEWLVTMDGRLRRWDGLVALGGDPGATATLEARNRLALLERRLPALQEAQAAAVQQAEAAADALTQATGSLATADAAVNENAERLRKAERISDEAEAARNRCVRRTAELDTAMADLATRLAAIRGERDAARAVYEALPEGTADDSERLSTDLATARATLQRAAAALAAQDQAEAVERERQAALRRDLAQWKARAGETAGRLAETARLLREISAERATVADLPASLTAEIEGGEATGGRLEAEREEADTRLARAQADSDSADARLRDLAETLSEARERRAASRERAENEAARQRELERIAGERFDAPPDRLPAQLSFEQDTVSTVAEESSALERATASRERIGPVNLVAARELAEIEAEHGASETERAELAEAVARLRGSIGSLNREGRERLRTAFAEVDRHFRRLFARLFDGGQAHLALEGSDDPLEAGLEIFAQPPGKRLQSLTLLSGGEQALTAIALIFALFLTNPAPICVLDEVDAPLDDANIDRFCDLLDAMVRETTTRYLIVTHNAVTMSRMHRLFGVTMVEQGVSRLVSVELDAAEQLLAAE